MFGYVICNRKGLSKEEQNRYQSVYCGLCKAIEKKFGQAERFTLSYDMTFVALFLCALYEPKETEKEFRCPCHPMHTRTFAENEYIDYAADMSIALTYHKCMDDWQDEKKKSAKLFLKMIEKEYQKVRKKYPRQCETIESSLKELSVIEKEHPEWIDEAINFSGKMLSEVFVYQDDFWADSLRTFGYELGRFIYLMDAAMDYEKDRKKKNYNPLFYMTKKPEEVEEYLTILIGNATKQYEKLPIVQDAHLIENVLYGGVWQQYYMRVKEKKDDNGSV